MDKSTEYLKRSMRHREYKQREGMNLLRLRMSANQELRRSNHKWFRVMDVLFVLMLLMNFGALFITGALVMKEQPNKELKEANPTQCEWNGWSCHPDAKAVFFPTIGTWLVWGVIVAWYIINRFTIYDTKGLWMLLVMMLVLTVVLGADFVNDLGLYTGKVLYAMVVA